MRIKRLSLHGFKSFADKTIFHFDKPISGVVGPNGCGKSNIIDSIRWVIGEHNARHLRGKVMEDLIFGGSEKRKPLGMAEVVLTFSNKEGMAPAKFAAYTEIEVCRRLYRSGDSEYYINKVPVRLKDIVELFTDTGVGSRAYSIIEQGQVGALIMSKPEDRRIYFEEAAGIHKYKIKKDAALRKLKSTDDNLTRVKDIVSEVKRQLNSLNRQAKKAERFKVLKDELRELELYLAKIDTKEFYEKRAEFSKELNGISDSDIELETKISQFEATIEKLNEEYMAEEATFKEVRTATAVAEKTISDSEKRIELTQARIEELKRLKDRLMHDIEDLTHQSESLNQDISSMGTVVEESSADLGKKEGELTTKQSAFDEVSSKLSATQTSLKEAEADNLKAFTRLNDIKHTVSHSMKESEELTHKNAQLEIKKEELAGDVIAKDAPIEELRRKIGEVNRKKEELINEGEAIKATIVSLEEKKNSQDFDLKEFKDAMAMKKARLMTLDDMAKSYDGAGDGVKSIMEFKDDFGARGILGEMVEIEAGYEKAVEAVLGDKLSTVMVNTKDGALKAINNLKEKGIGRASLVVAKNDSSHNVAAMDYQGLKALSAMVKAKDGFTGLVNTFLDGVFVAPSMEEALNNWNDSSNSNKLSFVTIDGDLIDSFGIITGGDLSSKEDGLLRRKAELQSLDSDLKEMDTELAEKETALIASLRELEVLSAKSDELRRRVHEEDINRVNLEGEFKAKEEELDRVKFDLQNLKIELESTVKRLEELKTKKVELNSEREELESAQLERDRFIVSLSDDVKQLNSRRELSSHDLTELKVSLASTRERFESVKAQLTEKETLIRDVGLKIESKGKEIESSNTEVMEKSQALEKYKASYAEELNNRDKVKENEVLKEESIGEVATKLKKEEAELKEIRANMNNFTERKNFLKLELEKIELSLENIREKIVEKYGAALESYTPSEEIAAMEVGELKEKTNELREKVGAMGDVSISALEEFNELEVRYNFLIEQQEDLNKSINALHSTINRINRTTREKFKDTFEKINATFKETFPKFFRGGKAELVLVGEGDVLEAGIEIVAQPPGKKLQSITLLSGGEKALTATALIFSIFMIKPSPFCILDEVDAPLDEANIDRFNMFVKEMSAVSQFIVITHSKRTMEMLGTLYGITMEEPGVSKAVSVDLSEGEQLDAV